MFSSICFANFFHEFFSVSGVENEITPNIQNKYLVHVIAQPNFQIPNPQWVSTIDVGGSAPNSHLWVSILVVLFNKLKKCTLQKPTNGYLVPNHRHLLRIPIFTTKFCLSYVLLDQKQDQQSAAPYITLSKRASKKCVSQKNQ